MTASRPVFAAAWRPAVLSLVTVLAYLPVLRAGFVWDDVQTYVVENPLIQQDDGLVRIWTTRQAPDFYPLTFTSWWIDWRLWGGRAWGFHAVNILLHAASACLLWRVLLRMGVPGAWLAAILWAVHPVNAESVAWISQRKNTLSAVFFLSAVLAWLRSLAPAESARTPACSHPGFRAWALAFFLLALLGKSATVVLPPVLLLLCWWQRGRVTRADWRNSLPFWALAIGVGLVTVLFQGRLLEKTLVAPREAGPLQRLLDAAWAVWFYLAKALLPVRLAAVYPHTAAPSALAGGLSLAALGAAAVLSWRARHAWGRSVWMALACFVVTLLPVLGFIDIGFMQYAIVADHWQYLSLIAPVALLVGIAAARIPRTPATLAPSIAALAVGLCGLATYRQAGIYHDEDTLWRHTLRRNPKAWIAAANLGKQALDRGDLAAAEPLLARALAIEPRDYVTQTNLATLRARQGRTGEAAALFVSALERAPHYATARVNRGVLLLQEGHAEAAREQFERALQDEPGHAAAHFGLGNALLRLERHEEAARHFQIYTELRPGSPDGYYNLAMIRLGQGDAAQARRLFEAAATRGDAEARRRLDEMRSQPGGTAR